MTQAGLERCPTHETPLHDGRCDRCEYELPRSTRELGKDRVAKVRGLLASKRTEQKPPPERGVHELVTRDPTKIGDEA